MLCNTRGEHRDVVLGALRSCPRAVTLLGDQIDFSWMGWSCGNARYGNDTGGYVNDAFVDWTQPVRGTRGRGSYSFAAEKVGRTWRLVRGSLEVGNETIDVGSCGPTPATSVEGSKIQESIGSLQEDCDRGNAASCFGAGVMLASATSEPDHGRALEDLTKACQAHIAGACETLAAVAAQHR